MAKAIILPTLLYGAKFLDPQSATQKKMKVFLNRVGRSITNYFFSMNTNVLAAESCLIPIDLYLEQIRNMATVRWASTLATNNIATALIPFRVPLSENYGFPWNRRLAFARPGGLKPKIWNAASYTSVQKILLIDMIAGRARILFPQ